MEYAAPYSRKRSGVICCNSVYILKTSYYFKNWEGLRSDNERIQIMYPFGTPHWVRPNPEALPMHICLDRLTEFI